MQPENQNNTTQKEMLNQTMDAISQVITKTLDGKDPGIGAAAKAFHEVANNLEASVELSDDEKAQLEALRKELAGLVQETKDNSQAQDGQKVVYQVIIHNDDKTSEAFVFYFLNKIFGMSFSDCQRVVMEVNKTSQSVVGLYLDEAVAQSKVQECLDLAKVNGFELNTTLNKVPTQESKKDDTENSRKFRL